MEGQEERLTDTAICRVACPPSDYVLSLWDVNGQIYDGNKTAWWHMQLVCWPYATITMAKKNQTSTSFAYYSSKNARNSLKFLLKLVFSIIELRWKNYWTASNSFWITRNFVTLIDWQAICLRLVKMNEVQMVKFKKIILNVGRSAWNLKWKLSTL